MPLPVEDLEAFWAALAEAIDRAGPERDRVMLAKLALALADRVGDAEAVAAALAAAQRDL
jgi:hypothetical protein